MNELELKRVVAKIQLGDNRQVDVLVLREWQDSIGDLNFEDAIQAVTFHRRESAAYLMPAHVRSGAARAREIREREERRNRPALEPSLITLDRAKFERETAEFTEKARAAKNTRPIDPGDWS